MLTLLHSLLFIFLLGIAIQVHAKKPNFIVILTDGQGYQDLGCFGSPNIRTPNLDNEVTIPEILIPMCYATGMTGKWDLQGRVQLKQLPLQN